MLTVEIARLKERGTVMSRTLIKKRFAEAVFVILAAALIIFIMYYPGSARSSSWATTTYTWERVGTSSTPSASSSDYSLSINSVSGGVEVQTVVDDADADGRQNYFIFSHTCTTPAEKIKAGNDVSLTLNLHVNIVRHDKINVSPMASCCVRLADPGLGTGAKGSGSGLGDYSYFQGYQNYGDQSYTVSGRMPDSTNEGEEISIYFVGYTGNAVVAQEWKYRLKKSDSGSSGSGSSGRKAAGTYIDKKGLVYKVLSNRKSVMLMGTWQEDRESAVIPASIKVDGYSYKVTRIDEYAFKGLKKLKKVTIGKNVSKIGKKAFYGCSKLKTITVKTTKLRKSKIGKNAFTKLNKKAVVKCPKGKKKLYRKIFRAKGCPKKVRFK